MSQKYRKYSKEDLKKAIHAVKNGMPCFTASKQFRVPRVTLYYKVTGKYAVDAKSGTSTILTSEEEHLLTEWIISVGKTGFPVTKDQLLDSVTLLIKKLNRDNNFTNGHPGRHWYEGFLRRHPEISKRMTQNLTSTRASVSEISIRNWFKEVKNYFDERKIKISDPRRIFNADETAFFLCPKGKKALVQKGSKSVYTFVNNNEKECLTTLITGI